VAVLLTVVIVLLLGVVGAFVYMTAAVNADADLQDGVVSAPPIADDPAAFLRAVHGAAGEAATQGNAIALFQNGDEIFPAMAEAIRAARETVHFATYVFWAGTIPDAFAALFCETARRGVSVRLVIDSEGSDRIDPRVLRQMQDAGCEIGIFAEARWYSWMQYDHRTHRRLLIVDGRVGFTGGVGMADEWAGDAEGPGHWRDTHARITGPVVASLQAAFVDTWNRCTDDLLLDARGFPPLVSTGSTDACLVVSTPASGSSEAQRTMAACIAGATRRLWITNAYFVPTPAFVRTLGEAVRRGVEVRILVPGPQINKKMVRAASRHVWAQLLSAGVELYEFQPTMVHCKTLVVDGRMGMVGSINFDPRSFALNSECAVLFADDALAAEMERVFTADLVRSRRVTVDDVRARSTPGRARDAVAYWLRAQL
jgi:cardiolipin synthase